MTATNHALTGAAIAILVKQPVLAPVLAVASHFVCDAIPHWDYSLKFPLKKYLAILDVIIGTGLCFLLALLGYDVPGWLIVLCGILAMLPDAMWLPHILRGSPIPFDGDLPLYWLRRFHRWVQWSETKPGLYVEAAWFLFIVSVLLIELHRVT